MKISRSVALGGLLVLASAVIYAPYLSRTIQYDEAYTYLTYAHSPFVALFAYTLPNNHLLHSFFVWLSTSLIGDSVIGLRFPAFAAGLLAAAMMFRIGSKVAGAQAGVFATVLFVTSALFAEFVTNGRGYTLSALLTLALFELVYFRRRGGRVHLLICWLMIITLPTLIFPIASSMLWVVWKSSHRWKAALEFWPPMIVGAICGALFYAFGFTGGHIATSVDLFGYDNPFDLFVDWLREVFSQPLRWWFTAGALVGLAWLWRRHAPIFYFLLVNAVLVVVAAFAQYFVTDRVFYPRNYFYLLPLVALAGGVGYGVLLRPLRGFAVVAALPALIVGGLAVASLDDPTLVDQVEDAVQQNAEPDDLLLIGCCEDYPIYYLFRHTSLNPRHPADHNERLVIIPGSQQSLAEMTAEIQDFDNMACEPEQWQEVSVLTCPLD